MDGRFQTFILNVRDVMNLMDGVIVSATDLIKIDLHSTRFWIYNYLNNSVCYIRSDRYSQAYIG